MKKITIEEHFSTKEHLDTYKLILEGKYPIPEVLREEKILDRELPFLHPRINEKNVADLLDIGEGRLREMDEAGIDMQVLSLISPGVQALDAATGTGMAKKVNDILSEAVKKHPKRLAGFASIAPQNPKDAAEELERAVVKLGLKGASINSHTKGEYLDDEKYWVIFERAESLGVPIYIHPRCPSPDMATPYLKYQGLATAMLGFAAEVSLHALRLIYSGVFDRYPKLQIILGHLGEALPYWLWRLDNMWQRRSLAEHVRRLPSEYMKENFFVTTSGIFSQPPLICSYLALGAERILFAVDYPLEKSSAAIKFIEEAPICDADKEKICHLNAEKLLGL